MNAGLVGRSIRWTQRGFAAFGLWLLAACAEPATVDPRLVPEASVDVRTEAGDAEVDAEDASTGTGGSGGSGGSGGTGGGGAGARPDAADANGETSDASAETGSSDAPSPDSSLPPDGSGDATNDPSAEPPPQDGGRGDAVLDIAQDRDASADRDGG